MEKAMTVEETLSQSDKPN